MREQRVLGGKVTTRQIMMSYFLFYRDWVIRRGLRWHKRRGKEVLIRYSLLFGVHHRVNRLNVQTQERRKSSRKDGAFGDADSSHIQKKPSRAHISDHPCTYRQPNINIIVGFYTWGLLFLPLMSEDKLNKLFQPLIKWAAFPGFN